jgi:DNA-binding transcriptional ArsR family regulator
VVAEPDIATIGAALADEARAAMLVALLGGESLSAGELARRAGVSQSGASNHLRTLREAGLVTVEPDGRSRYYHLANAQLAEALEALALIAPPKKIVSLRQSEAARALKRGRSCYDHLAGELGVSVSDALVELGVIGRDSFTPTDHGELWLERLNIDLAELRAGRRTLSRVCLDWTERRPHLAGALGAAIAAEFFARHLITRLPGGRAVAVTPAGAAWLDRELGIRLDRRAA